MGNVIDVPMEGMRERCCCLLCVSNRECYGFWCSFCLCFGMDDNYIGISTNSYQLYINLKLQTMGAAVFMLGFIMTCWIVSGLTCKMRIKKSSSLKLQ